MQRRKDLLTGESGEGSHLVNGILIDLVARKSVERKGSVTAFLKFSCIVAARCIPSESVLESSGAAQDARFELQD